MSDIRGRLKRLEQRMGSAGDQRHAEIGELEERLAALARGQENYLVVRPLDDQQEPTWYAWPKSDRFDYLRAVAAVCYTTEAPAGSVVLSEADIAELQRVGVTIIRIVYAEGNSWDAPRDTF